MDIMDFKAGGYIPASFLDWEGHVAAVIFSCGCNFRCPWCHNGELALSSSEELPLEDILSDIKRRSHFLDGVVFSGGEPTLWSGLLRLLRLINGMGLPVKLDTNGSNPETLERLLDEGLVECAAMDVKAPLENEAYRRLVCADINIDRIRSSIDVIKRKAPSYEFRTTYVPALHSTEDLRLIRKQIDDDGHWVVQCFNPVGCLDASYLEKEAADSEKVKKILPEIKVRG